MTKKAYDIPSSLDILLEKLNQGENITVQSNEGNLFPIVYKPSQGYYLRSETPAYSGDIYLGSKETTIKGVLERLVKKFWIEEKSCESSR